jgi:hypothetical protein
MIVNEAGWDRVVRTVAGLLMLYLGWAGVVTDGTGMFLKWFGFVPLLTGIVGFCPLYPLLGFKTKKA